MFMCYCCYILYCALYPSQHFSVMLRHLGCTGSSDFIWDFGKLPFPTHLGKYYIKIGKKRAKIHEIGKIKAIF